MIKLSCLLKSGVTKQIGNQNDMISHHDHLIFSKFS